MIRLIYHEDIISASLSDESSLSSITCTGGSSFLEEGGDLGGIVVILGTNVEEEEEEGVVKLILVVGRFLEGVLETDEEVVDKGEEEELKLEEGELDWGWGGNLLMFSFNINWLIDAAVLDAGDDDKDDDGGVGEVKCCWGCWTGDEDEVTDGETTEGTLRDTTEVFCCCTGGLGCWGCLELLNTSPRGAADDEDEDDWL